MKITNPFLQGPFEPVYNEMVVDSASVEGGHSA